MFRSTRPLDVLRSVVCLLLLGAAVTLLFRPALIVAGVLLPFALVGALTWAAYRLCRALARRALRRRPRPAVEDIAPLDPAPVVLLVAEDAPPAPRRRGRLGPALRTAFHVGVEVGCGAALGAALSVLADWQLGTGIEFPALGAAIGAVVGFVVGGTRPRAEEVVHDAQASPAQAA